MKESAKPQHVSPKTVPQNYNESSKDMKAEESINGKI